MTTVPDPQKARSWQRYQREKRWKLLEPGWAGQLADDELLFIVAHLKDDTSLCLWWGMRPSWKRIPDEVVRRIAMDGDSENQAFNRRLARPHKQLSAAA